MKAQNLNKAIMLADQALVSGSNLLLGVFFARVLGIEAYGVIAMAWLCTLFCSSIQQQFIIAPMQVLGANLEKESSQKFYGQLLYQQLLFAALCLLGVYCFVNTAQYLFGGFAQELAWLVAGYTFLFLMHDYLRKRKIARSEAYMALILDVMVFAVQLLFVWNVWHNPEKHQIVTCLRYLTYSYIPAVTLGVFFHDYLEADFDALCQQVKAHWKFSKWLVSTALIQWFAGNWYLITAGALLGPAALGALRMAQQIVGVLHIPFLVVENYLPVKAKVKLSEQGAAQLWKYLFKHFKLGFFGLSGALAVLALSSGYIVSQLFGESFLEYQYVIYGFTILYLFVYSGILLRIGLKVVEQSQFIFMAYVLNLLFAVSTANWFVQEWALYGVMAGLIASQLIMHLVLLAPILQASYFKNASLRNQPIAKSRKAFSN